MKAHKVYVMITMLPLVIVGGFFLLSGFFATRDPKWLLYILVFAAFVLALGYWVHKKSKLPEDKKTGTMKQNVDNLSAKPRTPVRTAKAKKKKRKHK